MLRPGVFGIAPVLEDNAHRGIETLKGISSFGYEGLHVIHHLPDGDVCNLHLLEGRMEVKASRTAAKTTLQSQLHSCIIFSSADSSAQQSFVNCYCGESSPKSSPAAEHTIAACPAFVAARRRRPAH